jgi:hypothetical protein
VGGVEGLGDVRGERRVGAPPEGEGGKGVRGVRIVLVGGRKGGEARIARLMGGVAGWRKRFLDTNLKRGPGLK